MLKNIVSFIINHPYKSVACYGMAGLIIYNLSKCPYRALFRHPEISPAINDTTSNSNNDTTSNYTTNNDTTNNDTTINSNNNTLVTRINDKINHQYHNLLVGTKLFREKITSYYSNVIHSNNDFCTKNRHVFQIIVGSISGILIADILYKYSGNLKIPNHLCVIVKKMIEVML